MPAASHTTRFAPSPTGLLHLGHAFAALTAFDAAPRGGFVLRIEDLDRSRCRPQFEAGILEDLRWLGLRWREPLLRQSSRSEAYRAALSALEQRGVTYPCFCTRAAIAAEIARATQAPHMSGSASEPDSTAGAAVYPGTCRSLSEAERRRRMQRGETFAVRLNAERGAEMLGRSELHFTETGAGPHGQTGRIPVDPLLLGDVVIARKDLPAAYHLAVVIDDAHQGITRVTRGHDLFSATHVQRLLQALLGLPAPGYAHHRLILDGQGRKLSKREEAPTLRSLRAQGNTPEHIRRRVGLPVAGSARGRES
jgi:glutamyl-Q tRNA(Asp) synthetase